MVVGEINRMDSRDLIFVRRRPRMTRSVQGSTDLAMPSPCVVWNVSICIMSYLAQGLMFKRERKLC